MPSNLNLKRKRKADERKRNVKAKGNGRTPERVRPGAVKNFLWRGTANGERKDAGS